LASVATKMPAMIGQGFLKRPEAARQHEGQELGLVAHFGERDQHRGQDQGFQGRRRRAGAGRGWRLNRRAA